MSPWTLLGLFALLLAAGLLGLALIERRAARSRRHHRGELALHRRQLRAMLCDADALVDRAARSRETLTVALRDAEAHLVDATAPCPAVPARCALPPRRARRHDGRADAVRLAVWREVAAHPRALGLVAFAADPRAPWRPSVVALPGELVRPAVLTMTWGHS